MESNLELKVINTIMLYGKILKEKGYLIKLKFWRINAIPLTEEDVMVLRNSLSYGFYNLFETLIRDGVAFNAYELEAFAKIFKVTTREITEFFDSMMNVASRLMYKSKRTMEEKTDVEMLRVDMEKFRVNMLRFIMESLMEMAQGIDEDIKEKYDSIFIFESLEFGGR